MALPKLNTPEFTTTIPSGKSVRFRPFLVKEEKMMLMAKESISGEEVFDLVDRVVRSCIVDDTNVDDLSFFDVEHLFILMRVRSVGEAVDVTRKCTSCEKSLPVSIDISKIGLSGEIPESNDVMLSDTVGITVKNLDGKNLARLEGDGKKNVVELAKSVIKNVYTQSQVYTFSDFSIEEQNEFVESLSIKQLEKVVKKVEDFPRCQIKTEHVCPMCGEKNEIVVEGIQNFFT